MNQSEIRTYVENYFRAFQSKIVENHPAYFSVELPVEVDKDLGNRPFYWTFVEKMGMEPNTLTLTLLFDRKNVPPDTRGEDLRFGSKRLLQIFDSAKKHGKYVRLYEETAPEQRNHSLSSTALVPWLGVNYKIEFICDQKRELLLPLGIHLISGEIVENFYEQIRDLALTPKLPDYSFTMQPIYVIESAADRLEQYIQEHLDHEDAQWARLARERLNKEIALVESYYDEEIIRQGSTEEKKESTEEKKVQLLQEKSTRLKELEWQHAPRIHVNVLNSGLFYLHTSFP